ncbi:MAG: PEGA domain-containing protein [bacterium]|nr:PEGA domain-containing protein [bacterium]
MPRPIRILIFYTFFLLFLIAAPVLLLYTSGYRYNFNRGRLEQVGALLLKSTPRGATIVLNGNPAVEATPALLQLPQNEYQIEIKKDGHRSWSKTLSVRSQETTFAEDIVLWKEAAAETIFEIPHTQSWISPNLRFIILKTLSDKNDFLLYDTTLSVETLLPFETEPEEIQFSPSGNSLLVFHPSPPGTIRPFSVIRLETQKPVPLAHSEIAKFESVRWGDTDGTLYGIHQGILSAVNLFTGTVDPIAQSGSSFAIRGTDVWSIQNFAATNRAHLQKSRAGSPETPPETVVELPYPGTYSIVGTEGSSLMLERLFSERHILVIDTRAPKTIQLEITGEHFRARKNRDNEVELLTWNDFELWRGNVRSGAVELLRRQSDPIQMALWYPRGEYVLFASQGRIEALELDDRDTRNLTRLFDSASKPITAFSIDPRNTQLLFTASTPEEGGVMTLELQ